mgnify:CR=1 FL=1
MNLISLPEAATRKGVTKGAIVQAVARGDLTARKSVTGRTLGIVVDARFQRYSPCGGKHGRRK